MEGRPPFRYPKKKETMKALSKRKKARDVRLMTALQVLQVPVPTSSYRNDGVVPGSFICKVCAAAARSPNGRGLAPIGTLQHQICLVRPFLRWKSIFFWVLTTVGCGRTLPHCDPERTEIKKHSGHAACE